MYILNNRPIICILQSHILYLFSLNNLLLTNLAVMNTMLKGFRKGYFFPELLVFLKAR